jgi:hypothetical protein
LSRLLEVYFSVLPYYVSGPLLRRRYSSTRERRPHYDATISPSLATDVRRCALFDHKLTPSSRSESRSLLLPEAAEQTQRAEAGGYTSPLNVRCSPIADKGGCGRVVRLVPKADIQLAVAKKRVDRNPGTNRPGYGVRPSVNGRRYGL